jgi:hypothetical protein
VALENFSYGSANFDQAPICGKRLGNYTAVLAAPGDKFFVNICKKFTVMWLSFI